MKKLLLVSMSFLWIALSLNAFSDSFDMTRESENLENENSEMSLEEIKVLADSGDINAQGVLGYKYLNGEGVLQDYQQAIHYYKLAAEQGDSLAQSNLGIIYDRGEGFLKNHEKAIHYYKLAAEQGDSFAQFSLGSMYYKSEGASQDYVLAYVWFNIAASQGDKRVVETRDMVLRLLTSEEILEAQAIARKCLESDYQDCER